MATTSIKFFYNGMRINGARELCKVDYSVDGRHDDRECVTIYERLNNYNVRIPRDLFDVQNDTDLMTDYFDTDSVEVWPDHPLYPFIRAAALKDKIKGEEPYTQRLRAELAKAEANPKRCFSWRTADTIRTELENRETRLNGWKNELAKLPSGHPSAADVARAVAFVADRREAARRAAEQAAEAERAAERAAYEAERAEGERIVNEAAERFPLQDGAPYVVIDWSEHASLDEGLTLSVPAAELILSQLDERNHRSGYKGYDKTAFTVHYTLDSEACTYEGRYDLGDDDGGLVAHIRAHGEYLKTCNWLQDAAEHSRAALALADMLDKICAPINGRVLSLADAQEARKKAAEEAGEEFARLFLSMIADAAKAKETPEKPVKSADTGRVLSFRRPLLST